MLSKNETPYTEHPESMIDVKTGFRASFVTVKRVIKQAHDLGMCKLVLEQV